MNEFNSNPNIFGSTEKDAELDILLNPEKEMESINLDDIVLIKEETEEVEKIKRIAGKAQSWLNKKKEDIQEEKKESEIIEDSEIEQRLIEIEISEDKKDIIASLHEDDMGMDSLIIRSRRHYKDMPMKDKTQKSFEILKSLNLIAKRVEDGEDIDIVEEVKLNIVDGWRLLKTLNEEDLFEVITLITKKELTEDEIQYLLDKNQHKYRDLEILEESKKIVGDRIDSLKKELIFRLSTVGDETDILEHIDDPVDISTIIMEDNMETFEDSELIESTELIEDSELIESTELIEDGDSSLIESENEELIEEVSLMEEVLEEQQEEILLEEVIFEDELEEVLLDEDILREGEEAELIEENLVEVKIEEDLSPEVIPDEEEMNKVDLKKEDKKEDKEEDEETKVDELQPGEGDLKESYKQEELEKENPVKHVKPVKPVENKIVKESLLSEKEEEKEQDLSSFYGEEDEVSSTYSFDDIVQEHLINDQTYI